MKAKWIGVVTQRTVAMVFGLAGVLVVSLPCRAQQPNVEQRKATAASLTADSAKRGENAIFRACGADNKYSLCITLPGADATDFAERIYSNSDFAKKAAHEGFAGVLIRNTTTDKKLSQDYAMNVTEQGWTTNDNYIHDAAEYLAVILAENQHDPAKKIIALRTYLQRYPNSVVKRPILQRLLMAQGQTGDREGCIATAKQLLAIVDTSDPERVHALWVLVYHRMAEANAGTNTDQNLREAKEYSEVGMQALELVKKPEQMTDEQFASLKSNASAAFKRAIGAEDARAAAAKQAVGENSEANAHSVQAAASNTAAIPGRLSSEQMKAIFAAADEEKRQAFSDLAQQTSALPSTLLSIPRALRRKYPTTGIGTCEQKTSDLQRRLGSSLNPKQVDDIFEMNQLLMLCEGTLTEFAPRDTNNIYKSVNQAYGVEKQREEQIQNASTSILQVEGALDRSDFVGANQLFQGLLRVSPLPHFALSYLGQTQGLREDLLAYAQAAEIDHGQNLPLSKQVQSLGREVSLLNECGSKQPLTQAYLQHAIKNGGDASKQQLAKLPTFQFNAASYRIPDDISKSKKLTLVENYIKTIDDNVAKVSEVRTIVLQPGGLKTAEEVFGANEATRLKATADQIDAAERMRGSLVDAQDSLQAKITAENNARAEKKAAEEAALRRSVALSLGLHSEQSQAQVKTILAAHGYRRLQDEPGQYGPWNCSSGGWKGGQWTTSCISQKGDVTLRLYFELGRMHRDADTGALQQVRTDRLLFANFEFEKFNFPDNTLTLLSPTLKKCHGEDDGDGVCFNF